MSIHSESSCPLGQSDGTAAYSALIQKNLWRTNAKVVGLAADGGDDWGPAVGSARGYWKWFLSGLSLHKLNVEPRAFHLFDDGDVASGRHLLHLAILMFTCALLGALVVWVARRESVKRKIGSACLAYARAFKLAFKVGLSSCLVAAIGGSLVPSGNYHMVSAGITVIIVMEMGSVDRLIVKGFYRSTGTVIGAAEAVLAIKVVETGRNAATVVFMAIGVVTVTNAMLQVLKPKQGYMYLASNITFVFVFYGYFADGAQAILSRILSVIVAVVIVWVVDILWPLVWLDALWFSVNNVVSGTEKVLRKTFAIIDFTFVHDEILAQEGEPETLAITLWTDRLFQPETVEFFQMKHGLLKLGDLQAKLSENAHGKRIANEAEVAVLHAEAKNAWDDIQFTYWLIRRRPPHNYYLLFERLHAVFIQSCSLSHMAYSSLSTSGRAIWRSNRENIERLRGAIFSLEPPMLRLLKLCHEERPAEVDAQVADIADALERAVAAVEAALQGVKTPRVCKQDKWRFEAFLMTVDLLIAELSTYVRKLLDHFGTHGEAVTGEVVIKADDDQAPMDKLISRLVQLSRHADM